MMFPLGKPTIPFLLLALLRCGVEAQPFARVCAIAELAPVYTVAYNEESNDYVLISVNAYDDGQVDTTNNNSNRKLRYSRLVTSPTTNSIRITQELNVTSLEDPDVSSDHTLKVRECPCALDTYCHVDLDTCGVPVDYSQPVGCFAKSTKKTLLRNAWPLLLLWYSTILFFLMCTEKGRNARNFMLLKVCKSNNNERIVDRFLYTHGFISTNPFTPQDTPSQHPLDWLPIARPVEPRQPTELVLKTTTFEPPPNDEDVEEQDITCTICFGALEAGDRVGKLSCTHTFHVDCLREWLPRRNVCPLCQTSNAATPRYGDQAEDRNNNNTATEGTIDNGNNDNDNNSPTTQEANGEGHVEMAPMETTVVEVQEDPRVASLRRPNANFAQQLLAVSRI